MCADSKLIISWYVGKRDAQTAYLFTSDLAGRLANRIQLTTDGYHVKGNPDPKHISTSYVERQNLTMRMGMRRFTRLTNGFSKKVDNLVCAVSLHLMYYNFVRIHRSLRVTPAMEAGITDHLWAMEDIAKLPVKNFLRSQNRDSS